MAIKINGNTVIDDSQNFTSTGTVSATGNITGQNIRTSGTVSATGNISANNLIAISNVNSNVVSAQTVSTNSVLATGTISAQSNVIGGNVISNGTISAGGNVNIAGNISAGGTITASFVNGNVTGNIQAPGNVGEIPFKNPNGYFTANLNMSFDQTNAAFFAEKVFCGNGGFGTPAGVTTMDIGNVNPTTIVMGGRATTINIGNTAGTTRIAGNLSITGNLLPAAILSSSQISTTGNITANIVNAANLQNTGLLTISTTSGNIAMQPAGNVVLNNKNINNVAEPTQDNDVATKVYVDRVATTGLAFHTAVTAATTANLATTTGGTITYTQPNGPGNGVAAKITTTGSFTTIDTANVQTVGTRILVKNEGNAVLNGVYTWANSTSIVRSSDADEYGSNSSEQLSVNDYFFVSGGNVNLGSAYVVDAPQGTIIFGTSNIAFAQFSQSQVYSGNASAGISLVGTVINAKTDGVTTAFDGNGNIIVKTSANLTTPNIGAATGTSLSTTGTVTGGNLVTAGLISSTGTITSAATITGANITTAGLVTATGNVSGGNLRTGGFVSAAGNVIAGNLTTVATGNVSAGNVLTTGLVSATGNIQGNFFIGNGSQLTGIDATAIQNGTANVRTFLNGNVTTSAGGTANVLNVTSTGTIVTGTESVTGTATVGNLATAGTVSATGNILGGANLSITGNSFTMGTSLNTVSINNGTFSIVGNVQAGQLRGGLVSTFGTVVADGNITGGNVLTAGTVSATGTGVFGNITTQGTISAAGNIVTAGLFVGNFQGNITGNLTVPGSNTQVLFNTNGNADAVAGFTYAKDSNTLGILGIVSSQGNVIAGNVRTAGLITATGNITGGNITTAGRLFVTAGTDNIELLNGVISASGNVQAGNIRTTGLISATGNITGGNVLFGAGIVSGTGNVFATNLTGTLQTAAQTNITSVGTLGSLAVTANVTGGNILTGGLISATSTITSAANITGGNVLTAGIMSSTGNGIHGNVLTGGLISATGGITGASFATTGAISGASVSASGNVTGGNIVTAGTVSATGNINTAGSINLAGNIVDSSALTISTAAGDIVLAPTGNVSVNSKNINNVAQPTQNQDAATKLYVDNLVSTSISYHTPVTAATTANLATTTGGTITYAQPGGAGNGQGATITTTGSFNLIDTANVQTANTRILVKDEGNAVLNGVYVWSNATVITRAADANTYGAGNVNALGLNDYFFVSSGNVNKGSAYIVNAPTGTITFGTSNISFAQFSNSQTYTANTSAGITLVGTVITGKVDGITTAFDGGGNISVKASANLTTPNIGAATGTSLSVTGAVNTATTISATGNITGGNILTAGLISVTGSITSAANLSLTGNIVDGGELWVNTSSNGNINLNPNGTGQTNIPTGILNVTGNIQGGNLRTAGLISATGAITGAAITGSSLTVTTGNITCGNIVNANGNGVGNIGSSSLYFNTVFAKATSAQYADLAEKYTADAEYEPGTVVQFGGSAEVTLCVADGCSRVAGVISTNPSYIMNGTLEGAHVATVALTGRVPTKVTGAVHKGDLMVSAGNGVARAETNPQVGTVIGKALEDSNGDAVIEVVVGRF
jgi:hypothetical protein